MSRREHQCRGELRQELEEGVQLGGANLSLSLSLSLSHSMEPEATSQYSSADELESNSLLVSVNCTRL